MNPQIEISHQVPTVHEFLALRRVMGWPTVREDTATISLKNALFTVCLRKEEKLVGLGRVVGDGALYFYLSDMMVHPSLRGLGQGKRVMEAIRSYLDDAAKPGAMITLISLPGRESFYEKYGWKRCPNETFGQGMVFPK